MPTPLKLPYPPLVVIPSTAPLTWPALRAAIGDRLASGVSICVTTAEGADGRGGFFFHVKETAAGFAFRTFDRDDVQTFGNSDDCAEFINHVSGRRYSERMWSVAQTVNLRSDEEAAGEPAREG